MTEPAQAAPPQSESLVGEHALIEQPGAALVILFAITFTFIVTELIPMGVLQVMGDDLGQSEARIGFLVSVFALAVVLTAAPLAPFTSSLPRRPLLITLTVILSVGNLIVAFSDSYLLDVAVRFVIGVANGVFWGMIGSYAIRMLPPDRRGGALSAVFAGNTAALTLGIPISAAAALAFGWQATFIALGIVGLLLSLLALRYLPSLPGTDATVRISLSGVLRTPGVVIIAATTLLAFLAHFALYTYIGPFLIEAGIVPGIVAPVLFGFGIVGIAGVWLTGRAIDRRPREATFMTLSVFLLALIALSVAGYASLPLIVVPVILVWGLSYAAIPMLFQSAMLRAVPDTPDAGSAIVFTSVNLGISIGSFLGGQTLDRLGVIWIPILCVACVCLALILAALGRKNAFPNP